MVLLDLCNHVFGGLITICITRVFTTNTMVKLYRVAKPLLICGYHGLTIVTMVFWFYF